MGNQQAKFKTKKSHSMNDIVSFSNQYLSDCASGYYLLRTKPRYWAQVTPDQDIIIGPKAAPQINGNTRVTFVDVDEVLESRRSRFYSQQVFVYNQKVFNAVAYVYFKDLQGAEYIILIKDQRNWNVPMGRVDGDELTKAQNQSFLNLVRGVSIEKAHCILAALRECNEEAGVDIRPFMAKKNLRIRAYSSEDEQGHALSQEQNYATTVTMQIVIDLNTLTTQEIQQLQNQLRPQLAEQIKEVRIVPIAWIHKENVDQDSFFWQKSDQEEKQVIFKHVGRTITTLKVQKWMPFDKIPAKVSRNEEEVAPWYVMSENQSTEATIYTPTFYLKELRTAEQLQQDLMLCQQMTGVQVFNFSPERLALHETILGLSLYYNWAGEEEFEQVNRAIFEEQVRLCIEAHKVDFESIVAEITEAVTQLIQKEEGDKVNNLNFAEEYDTIQKSFNRILHLKQLRYDKLDKKIKDYNIRAEGSRPLPAERADHVYLKALLQAARENKAFIIEQTVIAQVVYHRTTQLLRTLLFENKNSLLPTIAQQLGLKPKTQYPNAQRKSVLIVGGPASGKGRVTQTQLQAFDRDIVELNPDLYKKLLLPIGDKAEEIKKHGSLTHLESGIIFDNLIDYWGKLAQNGLAPHILVDVARAGSWIRGKLGVSTTLEVHSPLLSVAEALNRSFERGIKTSRFAPTEMLLQSHKDQVSINLEAMQSGCHFIFYDTHVSFDQPLPIVATFSSEKKAFSIYNLQVLLEYFQKADLHTTAFNESNLWGHTSQSTIKHMLDYAEHMTFYLYSSRTDRHPLAILQKDVENNYVFEVLHWPLLQQQLGLDCNYFLQGLIENKVKVNHSWQELDLLLPVIEERLNQFKLENKAMYAVKPIDFDEQKCINTACMLIEQGIDYVRKVHDLWVYTPPNSSEEFNERFPHGISLVKITEFGERKVHFYNSENQLSFDIREFPDIPSCEKALKILAEQGVIESQHITMNAYIKTSYYCPKPIIFNTIQKFTALPMGVRAMKVNNPDMVQIIKNNGRLGVPKREGWIKCPETYVNTLTLAVQKVRMEPENEYYRKALLQVARGTLYCSGPFNIEDGYEYKISHVTLRTVFENLIKNHTIYIKHRTDAVFMGIKLKAPLTLGRSERFEANTYLLLAKEERSALQKALSMLETNFELKDIPGLHILTEDQVRRTYRLANNDGKTLIKVGIWSASIQSSPSSRELDPPIINHI
jgi:8-oxo-dGTP pyrophosphatase MutT (NUDIX family)